MAMRDCIVSVESVLALAGSLAGQVHACRAPCANGFSHLPLCKWLLVSLSAHGMPRTFTTACKRRPL
eukprot:695179-Pelagomonas_calceolata.AAC.2